MNKFKFIKFQVDICSDNSVRYYKVYDFIIFHWFKRIKDDETIKRIKYLMGGI